MNKPSSGPIPLGIGEGCEIHGPILDKNVRLGAGIKIKPFSRGMALNHEQWAVRDGIVVIPKNTMLAAGTRIELESS